MQGLSSTSLEGTLYLDCHRADSMSRDVMPAESCEGGDACGRSFLSCESPLRLTNLVLSQLIFHLRALVSSTSHALIEFARWRRSARGTAYTRPSCQQTTVASIILSRGGKLAASGRLCKHQLPSQSAQEGAACYAVISKLCQRPILALRRNRSRTVPQTR